MFRTTLVILVVLISGSDLAARDLKIEGLKAGDYGNPEGLYAKVFQVFDANQMLVIVADNSAGTGAVSVMFKVPTAGFADGKFISGAQWKDITGGGYLAVTGTTTYRSAKDGGPVTVFVLEVDKRRAAQDAAAAAVAAKLNAKPDPAAAEKKLQELDRIAAAKLARAKKYAEAGQQDKAVQELKQLVLDPVYAKTGSVEEANKLLRELTK